MNDDDTHTWPVTFWLRLSGDHRRELRQEVSLTGHSLLAVAVADDDGLLPRHEAQRLNSPPAWI
jgi:hypothetical protein